MFGFISRRRWSRRNVTSSAACVNKIHHTLGVKRDVSLAGDHAWWCLCGRLADKRLRAIRFEWCPRGLRSYEQVVGFLVLRQKNAGRKYSSAKITNRIWQEQSYEVDAGSGWKQEQAPSRHLVTARGLYSTSRIRHSAEWPLSASTTETQRRTPHSSNTNTPQSNHMPDVSGQRTNIRTVVS